MSATLYPDAMPDIRSWLRNHSYLASLSAGRVFFSIPPKITQAPFIRIYRSGGGPQAESEAPVSDIRVGIDVWGLTGADYTAVRSTVRAIEAAAHDFQPGTQLGSTGTIGLNVNVTTAVDTPDPDTGWPRIYMDAIFTVRTA
jgi:hypothetical protein